jgi:Flp pilus assembly protein TadG
MQNHVGRRRCASERGTVLIQTAIAILVLTALTSFVLDYGVLWVSRNQAQNAADAGALAGAIARAFDETADPPSAGGRAELSARWAARCASGSASCPAAPASANPVWPSQAGATSGVEVLWTCPPAFAGRCVTVNVYRDGTNTSTTLPTFFGPLLGINSQGIRATASARVATANAANCMRPFSVADKWIDNSSPTNLLYEHYDSAGIPRTDITPDQYVPPNGTSAGTGYRLPDDYGVEQVLTFGNENDNDPIMKGWSLPLKLPNPAGGYFTGGDEYREAIAGCTSGTVAIGDYLSLENGAMVGPTNQGFDDLRDLDPGATFNTSTKTIDGSCVPSCGPVSPRIVPIAVFDMDEFQWRSTTGSWDTEVYTDASGATHLIPAGACPGAGAKCVRVVNILGFFVDRMTNGNPKTLIGYLVSGPGVFMNGAPGVGGGAAFLSMIQLVR